MRNTEVTNFALILILSFILITAPIAYINGSAIQKEFSDNFHTGTNSQTLNKSQDINQSKEKIAEAQINNGINSQNIKEEEEKQNILEFLQSKIESLKEIFSSNS